MNATAKISSGFAILDVKAGRVALNRQFKANPKPRIPVVIRGFIVDVWGNDDGISREFQIEVETVETSAS